MANQIRITQIGKLLIATTPRHSVTLMPRPDGGVQMMVYEFGESSPLTSIVLPAHLQVFSKRGWDVEKVKELLA